MTSKRFAVGSARRACLTSLLVGIPWYLAELMWLYSLSKEKWFDIQCKFHSCALCCEVSHQGVTRGHNAPDVESQGAAKDSQECCKFFLQCMTFNPKVAYVQIWRCQTSSLYQVQFILGMPLVTPWTLLKNPNFSACTWVDILSIITQDSWPRLKDQNKDRFENWELCSVWKLPFCDHRAIKLTQNSVILTNACINLLGLRLPSHINTSPMYLYVSTCCSVVPFTCGIHCLGFVETRRQAPWYF